MLVSRFAFSVLRGTTLRKMAPTTRSLKRAVSAENTAADMGGADGGPGGKTRRGRTRVKIEYEEVSTGTAVPTASGSKKPRGKEIISKTSVKKPTDAGLQKTPTKRGKPTVSSPPQTPSSKLATEFKPPENWPRVLSVIKAMRAPGGVASNAAVDTMGCDRCHEDGTAIPDEVRRFQILIAAMLSSQTRDEVTHAAMLRLRKHGLTPQNILRTEESALAQLLKPVGFYPRKSQFILKTCQILVDQYGGDIPDTLEGLKSLPGVGPKMAYLVMNIGWEKAEGICVDVHVDRISVRLGWMPETVPGKTTRTPEDTRKVLESWLPVSEWVGINPLLVGLGQKVCSPQRPHCSDCLLSDLCPSAFKKAAASPAKSKS
mmetsp:Transcript_39084/g.85046  ORF Transcript_39084/g.85046 Transcript_39084/m.85046 type:complete len:373 (-) Transcript_39084:186-1304(-)